MVFAIFVSKSTKNCAIVFSISLQGRHYTASDLRQPSFALPADMPASLQDALQFCRQWLEGVQEFLLHTSGSTGTPKPMRVSRLRMQLSARATLQALGLKPGQRALLCMNPSFVAGRMMLVRAMEGELALEMVEPSSRPLQGLEQGFDFMAMVPLQLQESLLCDLPALQTCGTVIVGGAPLSQAQEQQAVRYLPAVKLYATYGMTETLSHVALRRLGLQDYFQALPGVCFGQDERGCLRLSAPVTEEEWLQTNDVVELLGPDAFRWLGRADYVVNSGGVKIHPEQVERFLSERLQQWGNSQPFFVAGVPDARLGERLLLFLEGEPWPEQLQARLFVALEDALGRYCVPKEVVVCPAFPMTETMKVKRMEVVRQYVEDIAQ